MTNRRVGWCRDILHDAVVLAIGTPVNPRDNVVGPAGGEVVTAAAKGNTC